jgi:hypothetical protein
MSNAPKWGSPDFPSRPARSEIAQISGQEAFAGRRHTRQFEPPDPLAELQALVAEYAAATPRQRNYGSARFADLFYWAVVELLPDVEPLTAARAAQIEAMLRRAEYGPGPARALAGRRRHLRTIDGGRGKP